jgi:DNA polymerase III subunit epsilon
LGIPQSGQFHRALSDAEMTAKLLLRIFEQLEADYQISHPTHEMLMRLQRTRYADVRRTLQNLGGAGPTSKR